MQAETDAFDAEFNIQMQKNFLSLLVIDKDWAMLNGIDILKPEYFENRMLANICKWITDYIQEFKAIPSQLILEEKAKDYVNNSKIGMSEFYAYTTTLAEIYDFTDINNLEYYKQKATEYIRKICWKKALLQAGSALSENTYEAALEKFKYVLSLGSEKDLGLDLSKLTTNEFLTAIGETYDKANMLPTGIPSWDKALGGGFVKNNVHIIAAPPGFGKSRTMAYLTNQALLRNKRVIFITLELTEAEVASIIYSAATKMSQQDLIDPKNRKEFEEKKNKFLDNYGMQVLIKFYKPNSISTNTIHNYIQKVCSAKSKELNMDWKPDLIVLDYMDKLLPTTRIKGNIYEDNGNVATDCKNLAISFSCPVITGSQLGRVSWNLTGNSVVSMDSIAESAQKVHIAHSMTTINATPAEKNLMRARFYVAKSRTGKPNTVIYCEQDLGRCDITEVEPWDVETLQSTATFKIKSAGQ